MCSRNAQQERPPRLPPNPVANVRHEQHGQNSQQYSILSPLLLPTPVHHSMRPWHCGTRSWLSPRADLMSAWLLTGTKLPSSRQTYFAAGSHVGAGAAVPQYLLRGGALLGDAVDVARVEQDFARLDAHHLDRHLHHHILPRIPWRAGLQHALTETASITCLLELKNLNYKSVVHAQDSKETAMHAWLHIVSTARPEAVSNPRTTW